MLETWREIVVESPGFYIGWGGLVIGFLFGYIILRTNFCTMGSISDFMSFGNFNRFRAWMLAVATAILGVLALTRTGAVDITAAMYLSPSFGWIGNVIGGLMFGFGMVFAGGCMSRNLVRAGSGDLRSFFVLLVAGISAFMTIGGLIGPLRVWVVGLNQPNLSDVGLETQGLDAMLAAVSGMDGSTARLVTALVLAGAILIYCFKDGAFRRSGRDVVAGIGIGLLVTAGWLLTGLAQDEFADVPVALASLTYTRPVGDTIDYLMRATAYAYPGFAVVTTLGALLGALVGSLIHKKFSFATFNGVQDTLRNTFGAVLMGVGGVVALGCTVGQGITGMSTLAVGSLIALVSIVIGGIIGIKTMEALA